MANQKRAELQKRGQVLADDRAQWNRDIKVAEQEEHKASLAHQKTRVAIIHDKVENLKAKRETDADELARVAKEEQEASK